MASLQASRGSLVDHLRMLSLQQRHRDEPIPPQRVLHDLADKTSITNVLYMQPAEILSVRHSIHRALVRLAGHQNDCA